MVASSVAIAWWTVLGILHHAPSAMAETLSQDPDVRDDMVEVFIKNEIFRLFGLRTYWLAMPTNHAPTRGHSSRIGARPRPWRSPRSFCAPSARLP